jgi:hypothetical protein
LYVTCGLARGLARGVWACKRGEGLQEGRGLARGVRACNRGEGLHVACGIARGVWACTWGVGLQEVCGLARGGIARGVWACTDRSSSAVHEHMLVELPMTSVVRAEVPLAAPPVMYAHWFTPSSGSVPSRPYPATEERVGNQSAPCISPLNRLSAPSATGAMPAPVMNPVTRVPPSHTECFPPRRGLHHHIFTAKVVTAGQRVWQLQGELRVQTCGGCPITRVEGTPPN